MLKRRSAPRIRLAPPLVLVLGFLLTGFVTWRTLTTARARDEARFRATTDQLAAAIEARVGTYLALLQGARGLLHRDEARRVNVFRDYLERLNLNEQYQGIQGIGFAQRVEPAERPGVTEHWRKQGRPRFQIWPEQDRESAFPIVLLEPADDRNLRALGYDMFSEPVRREAMTRAWHTGRPAASGKVTLVQETDENQQAGFLIYLPVYRHPPPTGTAPGPTAELEGFVYSPFRADDLFQGIVSERSDERTHVQVFDQDPIPGNLLHSSSATLPEGPVLIRRMEIGGRNWTVVFRAPAMWEGGRATAVWTLLIGLMLTSLLVLLIRNLESARNNSERHAHQLMASEQVARNSESLKQAILDAALDGIVTTDGAGQIVEFNPAAERTFGHRRKDVIGESFIDIIFPPRSREEYRAAMRAHLATGARRLLGRRMEVMAMRADGVEFPVELAISRIDLQGQHMFTAYLRDITERRWADAQIQELNEKLEHRVLQRTAELEDANRQLESFSYSVSHDLRAPARHVLGFAELLNKQLAGWSDPGAQRLVRVITESARRMAQLIDDLLTFSRTSRQELHRGKVNMDQRVEEALRLLAPELAGRRIEWQIAPLPIVEGDASLLTQVWVNLLSNAIKYTRRREVASITIEGHREEHQSVFSVSDNGTGFDLQYSQKLFGVFQRLHREEEFEGTGIGLANVARIVQRHGGRVWADAAMDRGATFYFTIPHVQQSTLIGPRRPGDGSLRGNGHSRPPTG